MEKLINGFTVPDLIEKWSKVIPDEWTLKKLLESEQLNILMVIGTNWEAIIKSAFAFSVIRTYCSCYDRKICLYILGSDYQKLERHREAAGAVINHYGISDLVRYEFHLKQEESLSYFLGCDAMLCFEESEDVSIPVMAAQFFHMPILAQNNRYTSKCLGRNQILLSDDPYEYAAGLHIIRNNQNAARFLGDVARVQYDSMLKSLKKEGNNYQ